MRKILLIFLLVFFFSLPVFAQQVDTAWVRNDAGSDIAVDSLGNVYVAGSVYDSVTSNDYVTIKYYPNGDTAWVRRYNGPGNSSDIAKAVAIDSYSNVYITGTSGTIKYDNNGIQLWIGAWGGVDIATDNSGNICVTGSIWDTLTHNDYITVRYYPNGDTAWVRRYSGLPNQYGEAEDLATAIALDGSGNIYVTGYSNGLTVNNQYTTIKYQSTGDTVWVRRYNGREPHFSNQAYDIALDNFGNVFVTGTTENGGTWYDYGTIKYYPNGDSAWCKIYWGGCRYDQIAKALAVDKFGNVYVTGYEQESQDMGGHWCRQGHGWDYVTIKYANSGTQAWLTLYNLGASDFAYDVISDTFGNIYVTGSSGTVKYDTDGQQLWTTAWPSRVVSVDGIRNVYVTGSGHTIKYWQNYPPNDFSLVSPSDSAFLAYVVSFDWETAIDPDPWDTAKYDLYVSTSSSFNADSTVIYNSLSTIQYTDTLEIGIYYWKVRAYDKHSAVWSTQVRTFLSALHGDANADKKVSVADVVYLINFLFKNGPAPYPFPAGDVNCDGYVTVSDVVYLINYLFKGGRPPC